MQLPKIYSDIDHLKKLDSQLLAKLVNCFSSFFAPYHVINAQNQIDFNCLKVAFLSLHDPDNNTVDEQLLELLHCNHAMATTERMDSLLEDLQRIDPNYFNNVANKDSSHEDVALYFQLYHPQRFAFHYMTHLSSNKRVFHYFLANAKKPINSLEGQLLSSFERAISEWCVQHNRPRFAKCLVVPKSNNATWFIITHGEPLKREGKVTEGETTAGVYYYPEKTDLIIYDARHNRLQIKTHGRRLLELYRKLIGEYCFHDADYFADAALPFTLDPLTHATDPHYDWVQTEGIERVTLSQVEIDCGDHMKVLKLKGKKGDLYPKLAAMNMQAISSMHPLVIYKAQFQIRVKSKHQQNKPRKMTIYPDRVEYTRNEDSFLLEAWLYHHGFAINAMDISSNEDKE